MQNDGRHRSHTARLALAAALLVAAFAVPFLGHLFSLRRVAAVPLWVPLTLLTASALVLFVVRAGVRVRLGLAVAILCVTGALVALRASGRSPAVLEQAWRHESSLRMAQTLNDVGGGVARMETLSASIGARVGDYLRGLGDKGVDDVSRFATFDLLDSLAVAISHSPLLPAGTEIGIQVFDLDGVRVAWAGWPQSTSRTDEAFLQSGKELVYSREVSLYRILTHLIPVGDAGGSRIATVMVDMPLEVNFRVNNRFLKSTSIAENIPHESLANLSFEYYPTPANLVERLDRFAREQERNLARRQKLLDEGHRRLEYMRTHRRAGDGGSEAPEDAAQRRTRYTIEDSVLTYFPFPAQVEPVSEISGDRSTGLQGRIVIRAPQGNPLLKVTAIGHPYRHYLSEREARDLRVGRGFLLAALVVLFLVAIETARGRSAPRVALRSFLYAGFMVLLRYSLLPVYTISPSESAKIFDPTVFATPILGGIMRSAGDLMITAAMFVAALYGLLRIVRGRGNRAVWFGDAAQSPLHAWHVLVKGLATAAVLYGVFELSRRFASTVVVNSNPRLLGDTMRVTDPEVVTLHLSMFLIFTGIILAGILLVWGMFRMTRGHGLFRSSLLALAVMVVVGAATHSWGPVLVAALLLMFVVMAPRFVQREDLVSIVIASFCLVVVSSAVAYAFLSVDYDALRKSFVLEKSDELLNPSDDWKVVILEDILGEYALRADVRDAVRNPGAQNVQRLAFDLWAESPLSLLGYSCAIHVITAEDSVISDFSVDMPYRVRITEGNERTDSPGDSEWAVLDLTRNTPRGIVRFYRGILNVDEARLDAASGAMSKQLMGRVIVDLPFFFESLEWAARTGPRTPEVLRNVQEGGVAPRVEEPEALLLARLEGQQVHESSSEQLPLGLRIPDDAFARALDRKWPLLRSNSGTFRFVVRRADHGEYLLAGFAVSSPVRHILRWSTLFSLYLLYTFTILVAIILLGTIPYLKELLPTLTPGRKLGFQQKLLASFLVVALVPAIILGVFSVNFIKDRFVEENRKEALYKAFSARKAFVNILHGELQFFLNQPNAAALFEAGSDSTLSVGNRRIVQLVRESGVDTELPAADDSTVTPIPGGLDEVSSDDLFFMRDGNGSYIGVVSAPVRVTQGDWSGSFYVFYGRLVDSELLGEIAAQVGADVNVYDDGELVASSREGLLSGGFISAIMSAGAFLKVSVLGSDYSLATERAGQYSYQVAYLPVAGWANRAGSGSAGGSGPGAADEEPVSAVDAAGGEQNIVSPGPGGLAGLDTHAAMSVPLLFRPESYYAEVQKATSIVLGIFALLFGATIGLGLVLARGIFEPLRALLAGTRRISDGDFSVHIPMRRADEIGSVVSAFNEMTDRVAESQRALDERRRYLETILENIGTGVISTDADDRIRTVNAAAGRILGIPEADVVGRTASELAAQGVAAEIFGLLGGAAGMRDAFVADEVELEAGGAGGETATVKYMLTRLEVEGRYLGTVFVFEDLTELISSKKLSAWVEMARQIAHEIKNPLTPIRISTQFMQRAYEQRPEQFERVFREGTETILHQVDVLKRIAGEFSSYGRMQDIEVAPHALDPIVRRIVAPYQNNAAGVHVTYENGLTDATVLVDPEAVRKICTNLIENALDAMPGGGDLRVSCAEETAEGQRFVRVVFRDTGPGLSEEAGRKLFEPYFSTKTTGTGLGLAICRQLSHAMGGDITVRNVTGGRGVEAAVTLRSASRPHSR